MFFKATSLAAALTCMAAASAGAAGISVDVVRIGVLTDMASLYSDFGGKGSVEAVKMAVEGQGSTVLGKPVEVVVVGHQNKPDLAASKAREWFESGKIDAVFDLVSSGVALAVSEVGREKRRPVS